MELKKFFKKYFRPCDLIVVAVVLAAGFSPVYVHSGGKAEKFSIIVGGIEKISIPADADTIITISAPLGPVKIEIADGKARVVESSCPHKICVRSGAISRSGQAIACVPNRLMVIAKGSEEKEKYDAILR
ncbi:NusG domain II-containing protein [bacterium]|nr:NusG domain II-containing protein [bacterium]